MSPVWTQDIFPAIPTIPLHICIVLNGSSHFSFQKFRDYEKLLNPSIYSKINQTVAQSTQMPFRTLYPFFFANNLLVLTLCVYWLCVSFCICLYSRVSVCATATHVSEETETEWNDKLSFSEQALNYKEHCQRLKVVSSPKPLHSPDDKLPVCLALSLSLSLSLFYSLSLLLSLSFALSLSCAHSRSLSLLQRRLHVNKCKTFIL